MIEIISESVGSIKLYGLSAITKLTPESLASKVY
jgi:hypothetical protein